MRCPIPGRRHTTGGAVCFRHGPIGISRYSRGRYHWNGRAYIFQAVQKPRSVLASIQLGIGLVSLVDIAIVVWKDPSIWESYRDSEERDVYLCDIACFNSFVSCAGFS